MVKMSRVLMMEEFSRTGGGQELFVDVYDSIRDRYSLSLITDSSYRNDLDFKEIFKTSYYYEENMNPLSIFLRVRRLRKEIEGIMKGRAYDIIFNNHPNIFIFKGDINYLHSFSFLDPILDDGGNIKSKATYEMIKRSGLYNIYDGGRFLTHGKYTLSLSEKMFPYLNITPAKIDYINIPVRNFFDVDLGGKEDTVLTFGRINKDKNLEFVIETARRMSGTKFLIAGAVNSGDFRYYEHLRKISPDNVTFYPSPSNEEKWKLYSNSKVYLHARRKEPYGITVAEAISFGCIPVVPKSGGPWVDIIEEGNYGLGYDDQPDDEIKQALGAGREFSKTVMQSRERFSFDIFKDKIINYFQEAANEKIFNRR